MTIDPTTIVVAVVLAAAVAAVLDAWRRHQTRSRTADSEETARRIVEEARKEADAIRKEAQVQAIAAAARSHPVLIPAWGLNTLAALLAWADLFVGCNSAPLHIAVSQGIPTVTIMGATLSVNWLPPAPQHRAVLAGLPCQPCEKNYCGPPLNTACLRTLTPETVFAAVQACAPAVPNLQRVHAHVHDQP